MGNVSEMDLTISLNLDTDRGSRTPQEQRLFREALEAGIAEHLRDCGTCAVAVPDHHVVKVDYDPDDLLSGAAARAGIDMESRELPCKTTMVFRAGSVRVSEGYGSPYVTIWGQHREGP
jgi:hypothetical protein